MDAEVIVVGAGIAGLRCAAALAQAGRDVLVLEAAEAVGGRVRTEHVDGFLVDRGFQLLNPAYPAVRRWVDTDALDLQAFGAGVAAVTERGTAVLGHPLREPRLLGATLRTVAPRVRETASLLRWAAPLLRPRRGPLLPTLQRRADVDRRTGLDAAGVDGLLRRVVDAFLAGVLLEDDGSSADRFALLLANSFARGVPSLPAAGMQALPDQLARPIASRVHLEQRVTGVSATAVHTADREWTARRVVLATGPTATRALTGLPVPAVKGVSTVWWAVDDVRPTPLLHVDARERPTGPLANTAVMSAVAPTYAPAGRHLVQGSALLRPGRSAVEAEMRRHAGELLGADASRWEVVARHDVHEALPVQPAPFSALRTVEVGGVVVCGDHRDTGSLQGALVSGQRAADAVLGAA